VALSERNYWLFLGVVAAFLGLATFASVLALASYCSRGLGDAPCAAPSSGGPKLAGSVNPLMFDFCWVVYYGGNDGGALNRMIAFL
jgi:hypothetical protein